MNVLFHTTSAIGIAVLCSDVDKNEFRENKLPVSIISFFAFLIGIIAHGALDYIPHCYPIHSKLDVVLSFSLILTLTFFTYNKYRWIIIASFLGCIFPDVIDLSPGIVNNLLGLNLPTFEKIFPWHWHSYSGSIYNGNCSVSMFNHLLLLITVGVIVALKWSHVKGMIRRNFK